MKFVFKGETIDYDFCSGHKNTILFLHGWGCNKNSFASTINIFKHNYNILTLTMPTNVDTTLIWTMSDYVDLVHGLLKIHNLSSVIVICHSFGFRVASLMNKNLIKKLVVTGGAGPKNNNFIKRIKTQNNIILLKQKRFSYLYKKIASNDYISLSENNKQTFKNIVNLNTKNFAKFDCPVLLFWGKNDKDTKIWIAKKIKKTNSAKLVVTKSDHFAYLTMSALFNHCILEFLK
ncbi:MAG: alpha/beta hydrolase [Clostridia bacterium]|nr:alpha/beta hydrolase [Clostridia bacterium]